MLNTSNRTFLASSTTIFISHSKEVAIHQYFPVYAEQHFYKAGN